jgi:hypothetical protein
MEVWTAAIVKSQVVTQSLDVDESKRLEWSIAQS